ncbi:MAG: 30S ribosomal protein S12 methylthiotransferase RimO [Chitinophagales bacterium]|nr:30S ribosomal protein S12 methylthiotransferase RimO [Chitinophagales bacterium]
MKTKSIKRDKVSVITLGCSKNLVDSEVLMNQLQHGGYDVQHDKWSRGRNIVIVNTCGFIDRAKEESINTIMEYAEAKGEGKIEKLYVTGCLSHRYKDNLEEEIPEVDAFFGTNELPRLLKTLKVDYKHELVGERLLTTPVHYAYMKISEGCNRTCSFCAIPLMRGKHVSRSVEELVTEAKLLAAKGVKEIMLIAQELTFYGLDIYKKRRLPELLEALSEVEGIEWLRLHYAYPAQFPMEIADAIAANKKVCNYLDMPLQHASDKMLSAMRRNITRTETEKLIEAIRKKVPDIALRTTMLVGFPGESEQDFEEMKQFVEETKFERLGVFTYSHEENTRGYQLPDDVSDELKQERAAELMSVQEEISRELNRQKIGKTFKVLFDRKEGGYFIGRTEYDSPEVDNEVLVDARKNYVRVGDFADVKIVSAEEFDLYGEVVS